MPHRWKENGMFKIFIDGREGTTGLQIQERLKARSDLHLLEISEQERKNPEAKKKIYKEADLVILCLPDEASREAVRLIDPDNTSYQSFCTAIRNAVQAIKQ